MSLQLIQATMTDWMRAVVAAAMPPFANSDHRVGNDRELRGRAHSPTGSPQDCPIGPPSRTARIRAPRHPSAPQEDPIHAPRRAAVREPCRDTAHDHNVRRQLRDVMDEAGVADVTPHRFRRTAATAINEIGGLQLASELLGHSDPRPPVSTTSAATRP